MTTNFSLKRTMTKSVIATTILTSGGVLLPGIPSLPKEGTVVHAAEGSFTVTADVLNVRSGAGTYFSKIGSVIQGTELDVIEKLANGWYRINYNGETGYVSSEYVYSPAGWHEVTAYRLNVRSGPGNEHEIIDVIENGTKLEVIHTENNDWLKINYNGKMAYVYGKYVSSDKGAVSHRMDIPLIAQRPELPSGCEATSLAMALAYYGVEVDKSTLAQELPYDTTELVRNPDGTIKTWGDPEVGFVGTPFGNGYTINPGPLKQVVDKYRPGGLALTGKDFSELEQFIGQGKPVLVWFTIDYGMPDAREWKTPAGKTINASKPLHNIVITGVDSNYVYFNDSEAVKKDVRIPKEEFINVYNAMGKKALVIN